MKARYWIAVAMVFLMTRAGSAALVWDATFDTDADGVVNLRTDNDDGDGQLMIGGNSGGVQTITTESQTNTLSNKAGRSVGGTLGHTDAFGALYTFTWDFQSITTGQAPEFFAGFTSAGSPHSTRQFMGARFIRQVDGSGNQIIRLGGGWASEGFTGSGRNFAGDVDLGPNLAGRPLQLAIGYDGSSHVLDVGLFDGVSGTELSRATKDIRLFDNLGVPSGDPALNNELNFLALTHAGWTDFIGAVDDIDTIWNMDSLRYYNDAAGAFGDVVPEPATALLLALGGMCVCRRRR